MDGDTLKAWIGDPEAAPPEKRAAALTVRAFLAGATPADHAGDVAALPDDVATALVSVLESAHAVERLAVVRANASSRVARKAAGKALHRLGSKGVVVPDAPRPRGRKVSIGKPAAPHSWFTHHDGSGAALTILGDWDASYGAFFVLAIETEDRGLQVSDFVRGATRKMERELIEEMHLEKKGVAVSADVARALIAGAVRRTRAAGHPLPEDWDRVAPFVVGADESLARPSVALPDDSWRNLLGNTPGALASILADWYPDGDAFNEAGLTLHAAASSQLAISDQQRAEFVADSLARHMDRWFDDGRRDAWAARFERAALLLDCRKEPTAALVALASARALRERADESPASEHPVLRRHWDTMFHVDELLEGFLDGGPGGGDSAPDDPASRLIL